MVTFLGTSSLSVVCQGDFGARKGDSPRSGGIGGCRVFGCGDAQLPTIAIVATESADRHLNNSEATAVAGI
jgi:hypothetical protein